METCKTTKTAEGESASGLEIGQTVSIVGTGLSGRVVQVERMKNGMSAFRVRISRVDFRWYFRDGLEVLA